MEYGIILKVSIRYLIGHCLLPLCGIMNRILSIAIIVLLSALDFASRGEETTPFRYDVEFRQTLSGGKNTPFWFVNNLQGLGSPYKGNGYISAGLFRDLPEYGKFRWEGGCEIAGAWKSQTPFRVQQLYAGIRYRSLGVLAGSKEMWSSFNNPLLSSGDLLFSGNSMPIPQLRAGIFDYAPFWGCKGWFSMKGYLAYGFYTDDRWQRSWVNPKLTRTEGVLFHSKGVWFKWGDEGKFPLTGEFGAEMATQFGGKSIKDGHVLTIPRNLKSFWTAFFPTWDSTELHDQMTRSIDGNMLGEYVFSLSWNQQSKWNVKAYYEHMFEDHSQMFFEYGWKDGLWGLEATLPSNPIVGTVVAEYLYTRDQTGPILHNSDDKVPEQVSGRDSYYNNSQYQGWSHWGMTIGNPLLLSPIYNADHRLSCRTNRVQAWHLGLQGNPLPQLDYRVLVSYSRNWGTYQRPLPDVLDNFNCLVEVSWHPERFKGWSAALGVATDSGRLLGDSFGVALRIGKSGCFSFGSKKRKI